AIAPAARIDCLDLSPGMLARARRRVATAGNRITFRPGDILTEPLPARNYDAVVTCFFLDCFNDCQAAVVVGRIAASLRPGARWLWADFTLPPRGPARWRARLWLAVLYGFFRWQTGISARALPDSEALIAGAGFHCVAQHTRQWGLLRTAVYRSTAA
ncbi:MAG: class I SAM-dependent methyltransferase, partial [Opitutales bacterium]